MTTLSPDLLTVVQRKACAYAMVGHLMTGPLDRIELRAYIAAAEELGSLFIEIGKLTERLDWLEKNPACAFGSMEAIADTKAELARLKGGKNEV